MSIMWSPEMSEKSVISQSYGLNFGKQATTNKKLLEAVYYKGFDGKQIEVISNILKKISLTIGTFEEMMVKLIDIELSRKDKNFFRTSSITNKLLQFYFTEKYNDYLKEIFGKTLQEVVDDPDFPYVSFKKETVFEKLKDREDLKFLLKGQTLEKLKKHNASLYKEVLKHVDEVMEKNKIKIAEYTEKILETMFSEEVVIKMPFELRKYCGLVYGKTLSLSLDPLPYVGSLFCPNIIFPYKNGFVTTKIKDNSGLVLLTVYIQSLSNCCRKKEMKVSIPGPLKGVKLNDVEDLKKCKEFLYRICTVEHLKENVDRGKIKGFQKHKDINIGKETSLFLHNYYLTEKVIALRKDSIKGKSKYGKIIYISVNEYDKGNKPKKMLGVNYKKTLKKKEVKEIDKSISKLMGEIYDGVQVQSKTRFNGKEVGINEEYTLNYLSAANVKIFGVVDGEMCHQLCVKLYSEVYKYYALSNTKKSEITSIITKRLEDYNIRGKKFDNYEDIYACFKDVLSYAYYK